MVQDKIRRDKDHRMPFPEVVSMLLLGATCDDFACSISTLDSALF